MARRSPPRARPSRAKVPGVLGVHLEGPFLNPERKGVHDPRLMRSDGGGGRRAGHVGAGGATLMTIAPEKVPLPIIARLAEAGVMLSAGHTTASYETMAAARAAGLTGVTHLFNAMPPLAGRDPGPVGAALDDPASSSG